MILTPARHWLLPPSITFLLLRMKRSLITLAMLSLLLSACTREEMASLKNTHVHGLSVDRVNSSRLFIATHDGLFVLTNDKELTRIGKSRDDFMGFSPHPTDPNILFSSGHSKGGGNIGFQKSTDGGERWKKISNGNPQGPADFHAMMAHPANPDHLYGWYKLRVHRSLDGGKTWEVLPKQPPEILAFAGDPTDDRIVYAGSIGDLLMSTDRFETFESIAPELTSDIVLDIEIEEATNTLILATRDHGFMRASRNPDGSFAFETISSLPNEEIPYYLALDPKNGEILYAFSKGHALYKSTDGGQNWQKVL